MRKLLLWGVLLGTLAVVVADLMHRNDGYAIVALGAWRVEMSLNFLVLVLLASLLVGALLLKLLHGLLQFPGRIARFRVLRRERRGQQAFLSALRLLMEGQFEAAIKSAERARQCGFASGYADLIAARAAQGLGDNDRSEVWLGRVDSDDPTLVAARLSQEADMLVARRQFEAALQVLALNEANSRASSSTGIIRATLRALLGTEQWEAVLSKVRTLRPRDGLGESFLSHCRRQAHLGKLRHYQSDSQRFCQYLMQIPRKECDIDLLDAADGLLSKMLADQWTAKAREFINTHKHAR
jgi:HemY protein